MSYRVATAMLARLEADEAGLLAAWADGYAATPPLLSLGWRRPQSARDWPYVALVPVAEDRDLLAGRVSRASVAVAVGVRLATQERPAADGIDAVDTLAEAALGVLTGVSAYEAGCRLTPTRARTVDGLFAHPSYELELRIDLEAPTGGTLL